MLKQALTFYNVYTLQLFNLFNFIAVITGTGTVHSQVMKQTYFLFFRADTSLSASFLLLSPEMHFNVQVPETNLNSEI